MHFIQRDSCQAGSSTTPLIHYLLIVLLVTVRAGGQSSTVAIWVEDMTRTVQSMADRDILFD